MDNYIGTIILFAGNFAPQGWLFCEGTLLPISSYTALFYILGTTYGGDGRSTFALPDLSGRVPIHQGNGRGLSNRDLGVTGGQENVTLTLPQMPVHSHFVTASSQAGNLPSPENNIIAVSTDTVSGGVPLNFIAPMASSANVQLAPQTVSPAGGTQPHENMPPFLALNYIIAIAGIFPSRP